MIAGVIRMQSPTSGWIPHTVQAFRHACTTSVMGSVESKRVAHCAN